MKTAICASCLHKYSKEATDAAALELVNPPTTSYHITDSQVTKLFQVNDKDGFTLLQMVRYRAEKQHQTTSDKHSKAKGVEKCSAFVCKIM